MIGGHVSETANYFIRGLTIKNKLSALFSWVIIFTVLTFDTSSRLVKTHYKKERV